MPHAWLSRRFVAGLLALTITSTIPCTNAAVILDNQTSTIANFGYADLTQTSTAGVALSVGATGYTLDTFDWIPVGSPAGTETATLGLYALDSNNKPTGSAIVSESTAVQFNNYVSATTSNKITIAPTNPSAWRLEANNKYALLLSVTGTSKGIALANPLGSLPNMSGAGMTYLGAISTTNSGANWSLSSSINPWARITGTAITVPEPSTYALGAIATGVMAAIARRRKARKA